MELDAGSQDDRGACPPPVVVGRKPGVTAHQALAQELLVPSPSTRSSAKGKRGGGGATSTCDFAGLALA